MTDHRRIAKSARRKVQELAQFVQLADAQFIWHSDLGTADEVGRSHSFVVVPKGFLGDQLQPLAKSTGADSAGWPNAAANNPELIFGEMLVERWVTYAEKITALAEFAKIKEAEWARRILMGMAYNLGAFYQDEDRSVFEELVDIDKVEELRDEIISRLGDRAHVATI